MCSIENSITTIGLYPFNDTPEQHEFLKACGINLFQFVESGYSYRPDLLDEYYAGLRKEIKSAPGRMDSLKAVGSPDFVDASGSVNEAIATIEGVMPNPDYLSWLPEPPSEYLDRLHKRLDVIKGASVK